MNKKWICPDCKTLNSSVSQVYYTEGTVLHIAPEMFMSFCISCCSTHFFQQPKIVEKVMLRPREKKVKLIPLFIKNLGPKNNMLSRIQIEEDYIE